MKKRHFISLFSICVLLFSFTIGIAFSKSVDSLESLIKTSKGSQKAQYLLEIGDLFLYNSPERTIGYATEAIGLSSKNDKLHFDSYVLKGEAQKVLGHYKDALETFNKCLEISEKTGDLHHKGIAHFNLSDVQNITTDYESALNNIYEAQKIFKSQVENKKWLANVYHQLGKIYFNLINNKKSIEFNLEALKIRKALADSIAIASSANNLAVVFTAMEDYDKAIEYNSLSLGIMQRFNDKNGIANSLFNIGLVYSQSGNYEEALKNYEDALVIFKEINASRSIAIVLANIAYLDMQSGDYSQAEKDINQSLDIAKQLGLIDIIAMNYNLLTQLYTRKEDYKNAFIAKENFQAIKDTIFNQETRNRITELEIKIETENEIREKELLEKSKLAQRNLFIVLILVALLLAMLLYSRYSSKKKANELLEKKNSEIAAANSELEQLNQKLYDANNTKDKFFSIISHDLRNPLYWFRNVTDILSKRITEMDKEKMLETTKALDETAKSSLHLVENLFQWAKTQTGRIEYNPANIQLKTLVDDIIKQLKLTADNKEITLSSDFDKNINVYADKNMLNTVLLNLVSNGLKYTNKGGEVSISAKDKVDYFEITVTDNGIGISEENLSKLFRIDVQHTTYGTAEESGSGLGLILCKEFTEKNGGSISVMSELGKGSTFTITIPKQKN